MGVKCPRFCTYLKGKWGHFQAIIPPKRGGLDTGLRGPQKGGSGPPKTPKIADFGSFLAILAKKGLRKPDFRDFDPPKTPQNRFFDKFCSKPWVPPLEIEKTAKKVSFSAWNFPKLSKSHGKRGSFCRILGPGAILSHTWGQDGHFGLSIPRDTSFSWP